MHPALFKNIIKPKFFAIEKKSIPHPLYPLSISWRGGKGGEVEKPEVLLFSANHTHINNFFGEDHSFLF